MKVGKLYSIPMPSYQDWHLCIYNALGCLRIVGNGERWITEERSVNSRLMNHMYYANDSGTKVNAALKRVTADVEGSDGVVCTSFRRGSENTILLAPPCEFKHVVSISGHDHTNICAAFEYLTCEGYLAYVASLALAGWKEIEGTSTPGQAATLEPALETMTALDARKFICFVKVLLCIETKSLYDEGGRLWPLSRAYAATILKDLRKMFIEQKDCIVNRKILDVAKTFGYTLNQLYAYGDIIGKSFTKANEDMEAAEQERRLNMVSKRRFDEVTCQLQDVKNEVHNLTLLMEQQQLYLVEIRYIHNGRKLFLTQ